MHSSPPFPNSGCCWDVVGAIVGLAVVGYSTGLAVGVLVELAVSVLVGLVVSDAKELAVVGDVVGAIVGAAEGGSGRSTPNAATAAIITAAVNNPDESSPTLYFSILCSSPP